MNFSSKTGGQDNSISLKVRNSSEVSWWCDSVVLEARRWCKLRCRHRTVNHWRDLWNGCFPFGHWRVLWSLGLLLSLLRVLWSLGCLLTCCSVVHSKDQQEHTTLVARSRSMTIIGNTRYIAIHILHKLIYH